MMFPDMRDVSDALSAEEMKDLDGLMKKIARSVENPNVRAVS